MKAFLLKVDSALYIQWTRAAKEMGISVSEWIRRQCSIPTPAQEFETLRQIEKAREVGITNHTLRDAEEKMERDAEDNPAQDLPRVGNVPAPERRAGVAQSVSASRSSRKKEREIKLCRHNLSECTICG